MNPILRADSAGEPGPDRYYARVDSIENIGPEGTERIVQLDGVAAAAFHQAYQGKSLLDLLDGFPLALMEFSSEQDDFSPAVNRIALPGHWVQVRILGPAAEPSRQPTEISPPTMNIDYYWNLFGTARTQLSEITAVEKDLAAQLDAAFSVDSIPDADPAKIQEILESTDPASFVVALDVGQGNANALWADGGGATLYFDFGGGVKANVRTFPTKGFHACFSNRPPIVLSHWDYDHWSSACRWTDAFDALWIAPRPRDVGVTHLAFAAELKRRGNLLIWPETLGAIDTHAFRIEKCTGTERNDSGLALLFRDENYRTILMTGDAAYDYIPMIGMHSRFDAVIASHHGARMMSADKILPAVPNAALIYSVGHGNYFGHPALHACLTYLQGGWSPACTASTAQHITRRPNSIGISLNRQTPKTGCRQCQPRIICKP